MGITARVPARNAVLSPAKFAHIVLFTKQTDRMLAWYSTVLGAEQMFRNDYISFLTYDDEHHRIAFINRPDFADPQPRTVGLAHTAYTYNTLTELAQTWERLKAQGIEPYRMINHGPTTSMYYRDPDGNAVELQVDNFDTNEALNAWFATGGFDRDPIGIYYDMAVVARKLKEGVPEAALRKPLSVAPIAI